MTDLEFQDHAESLLRAVETSCDRINDATDADVDNQRTGGMITLTFPNRSQIVINSGTNRIVRLVRNALTASLVRLSPRLCASIPAASNSPTPVTRRTLAQVQPRRDRAKQYP